MIISNSELEDRLLRQAHMSRSPEDLAMAQMLACYGIPLIYRQPVLVNETSLTTSAYLDTVLPTYDGQSINYLSEFYRKLHLRKQRPYGDDYMTRLWKAQQAPYRHDCQDRLYSRPRRHCHRLPAYCLPCGYS